MNTQTKQKLFSPVQLGAISLSHRVVMAPLTRSRSEQPGDIPGKLMLEYYTQRASEGGLIISEGTSISITGRGWFGAPGLHAGLARASEISSLRSESKNKALVLQIHEY